MGKSQLELVAVVWAKGRCPLIILSFISGTSLPSLNKPPLLALAWFLLLCVCIYVCTITVLVAINEDFI